MLCNENYRTTVHSVVPNGIASPGIEVHRVDGVSRPMILYTGRLRNRKAVSVLVGAFAMLLEEFPCATVVLVGDGKQRGALQRQSRELRIEQAVRFVGSVPRSEMARWYASADIFCLPSIFEGLSLSILEAMAHGLPVVATSFAGNVEVVMNQETGILVPPEDARSLAKALTQLAGDDALRSRMGRAGAKRFIEHYLAESTARAYARVYDSVVSTDEQASPGQRLNG